MTELFDTRQIRDDQEYWDSLAARVARTAMARDRSGNGLLSFAGSPRAWVVATVLVGFAVGGVLVSRTGSAERSMNEWNGAVQPSDEIGRAITAAVNPPSIGALLLNAAGTEGGGVR
jgi:hypothetical protein